MNIIENYTFEEEDLIIQSATIRKNDQIHEQNVRDRHFIVRSNSIKEYFLRFSTGHKINFIIKLLDRLNSLHSILQLLHVMSFYAAKTSIYSSTDPNTNFTYDKYILDHDRMLDQKTLAETMELDLAWFMTLEDHFQVSLIIVLLRMAGGQVKTKLYIPILRKYNEMRRAMGKEQICTVNESGAMECLLKKKSRIDQEEYYDPKHPATIEVEKMRKKWDDMIEKYKIEVEDASSKIAKEFVVSQQQELDEKKKKIKGTQSKASVKNTTKESSSSRMEDDMLSIQVFPIWIVKKIFGYLDQKSLQNVKRVGSYCSYVVQDLMKEQKTRQILNKYLEDMKTSIGVEELNKKTNLVQEKKHVPTNEGKLYEMGAVHQNLVPNVTKNLADNSLVSDAIKDMKDEFSTLTGNMIPFPRVIKDNIELYRYMPCFLKDVNIKFDVKNDIEKQKSFLTYSLSSMLGSLKISIDEASLSDW